MKVIFPGHKLCSGAFGGNIRPYTKQRARHGSPFLEPPPRDMLCKWPYQLMVDGGIDNISSPYGPLPCFLVT